MKITVEKYNESKPAKARWYGSKPYQLQYRVDGAWRDPSYETLAEARAKARRLLNDGETDAVQIVKWHSDGKAIIEILRATLGRMTVAADGTVRQNPKGRKMATKKPTAAQLAARARFAEMARSGAFAKTTKRKLNPLTRIKKLSEPSQRGDGSATVKGSRLYKRRKKTQDAPPGYYANPRGEKLYTVHVVAADGVPVYHIAHFRKLTDAKEYAQAYADKYKTRVGITSKSL